LALASRVDVLSQNVCEHISFVKEFVSDKLRMIGHKASECKTSAREWLFSAVEIL